MAALSNSRVRERLGRTKCVGAAMSVMLLGASLSLAQTKPTLTKARDTKVRLAYKGKAALIDLDNTDNVTLGGESWHRYRLFFTAVRDGKVYFLFQEQGGSPMSNPNGPCGGDSPQTLIWLQTDLRMRVELAKSEVFASCAFNGGRYQQGRTRIVGNRLTIVFEEHGEKRALNYDNKAPEKSFTVASFIINDGG
jgi:hypothetical protein